MSSGYHLTFPIKGQSDCGSTVCSFKAKSFAKGNLRNISKGILHNLNPDERIVVKIYNDRRVATEAECEAEVRKHGEIKQTLSKAKSRHSSFENIYVISLYYAEVDEVSQSSFCASSVSTVREGDWVLVQKRLDEPFHGLRDTNSHLVLDAFAHATYDISDGRYVMADVKFTTKPNGCAGGREMVLITSLTVHSLQKEFGVKDKGEVGIRDFFRRHTCSELCKDMLKYDHIPVQISPNLQQKKISHEEEKRLLLSNLEDTENKNDNYSSDSKRDLRGELWGVNADLNKNCTRLYLPPYGVDNFDSGLWGPDNTFTCPPPSYSEEWSLE